MSRSPRRTRSSVFPWAAVLLAAIGLVRWLPGRTGAERGTAAGASSCAPWATDDGDAAAEEECPAPGKLGPDPPILDAADLCPRAGYLCAGLEARGVWRAVRWNEDTREIRVRVPLPPGEPGPRAMALQEAAARGIRAWDGHPFPIRVDLARRAAPADITVVWAGRPAASELGHARTEWIRRGARADLEVTEFVLSLRDPVDSGPLAPEQVRLSAAHEMGHALGLPHSDDEGDVMYPTNTARRLSARDYRTLEALYALPNGAEIDR